MVQETGVGYVLDTGIHPRISQAKKFNRSKGVKFGPRFIVLNLVSPFNIPSAGFLVSSDDPAASQAAAVK